VTKAAEGSCARLADSLAGAQQLGLLLREPLAGRNTRLARGDERADALAMIARCALRMVPPPPCRLPYPAPFLQTVRQGHHIEASSRTDPQPASPTESSVHPAPRQATAGAYPSPEAGLRAARSHARLQAMLTEGGRRGRRPFHSPATGTLSVANAATAIGVPGTMNV